MVIAGNGESGTIVCTPWPGYRKVDRIAAAGRRVGIQDRLAKRARAVVGGRGHDKDSIA